MTRVRLVVATVGAALALVAAVVCAASSASAHGPASSLVKVSLVAPSTEDAGPTVQLLAKVALQQLDIAYGTDYLAEASDGSAADTVAEHADTIEALFLGRVGLKAPDGTPWELEVGAVTATRDQGQDAVRVVLTATGPVDADTSTVDLTWGVITDVVVTHDVYVGTVGEDGTTTLVATLTRDEPTTTLTVDDPGAAGGVTGSTSASGTSMWRVGFDHFREGADHLVFLSLLALGVARRRARWSGTARRLALLTLTFTVGHSLSLALATLGWVTLPSRWVEVAIAATIVVAALHAVRPRWPFGAEVAVTAAFGLVHGFGFAGTLEELSLHGRDLVVPLLTFNLGLETAQVAALVLVLGPLVILARSVVATRVLAGAAGLLAVSWIVQRAFEVADPLDPMVSLLLASPERIACVLAAAAVVTVVASRLRDDLATPRAHLAG